MMNNDDLLDDSDSSDEDYVPDTKPNEQLSEVESDGSVDEPLSDSEETTGRTTKKRKRKTTKSKKKQKTAIEEEVPDEKVPNEEEKKKNVDDIWADFLKDTGFQSRNSSARNNEVKTEQKPNPIEQKATKTATTTTKRDDKVKITQIFEFAGEEVKVEKEVSRGSAEARLLNQTTPETTSSNNNHNNNSNKVRTKGGLSGISNVLSQLGKKPKITTLEKSKLDWDQFKKEENLEEELRTFNKGKDGYLEKQDFLQRADLRRFEIEKEIRSIERSKRLNN